MNGSAVGSRTLRNAGFPTPPEDPAPCGRSARCGLDRSSRCRRQAARKTVVTRPGTATGPTAAQSDPAAAVDQSAERLSRPPGRAGAERALGRRSGRGYGEALASPPARERLAGSTTPASHLLELSVGLTHDLLDRREAEPFPLGLRGVQRCGEGRHLRGAKGPEKSRDLGVRLSQQAQPGGDDVVATPVAPGGDSLSGELVELRRESDAVHG